MNHSTSLNKPVGVGGRYVRVSTEKQDMDRQVQDIDRWLSHHGLKCEARWEDAMSRDKAEERHDFQRMMGAVRSRAVDWVVIQSIDRFGFKDTYEFFAFINTFRDSGVQLWSATDGVCISHADDSRILNNAIAGLTSTREQYEKSQRLQTKRLIRAKVGLYQGGQPPYGFDVLCLGADGKEKWRYVVMKSERRVVGRKPSGKVRYESFYSGLRYTSGVEVPEQCERVPPHIKNVDVMQLAPTIVTERLEVIRRVFKLMDIEDTNLTQIAKLLNDEKVDCVTTPPWTDAKLRHTMSNPVCIGRPASNKAGQPRFYEIQGGSLNRLESRGKGKHKRRPREEWVMPDAPIFEPIVDPEVFARVNAKLANKTRRAPKSEAMYLSPILYCARCGQAMYGFMNTYRSTAEGKITRYIPSYMCSTRNRYGPNNSKGCRFNCIQHTKIEPYILEFLAKRGQTLDDLITKDRDGRVLERLLEERAEFSDEIGGVLSQMRAYVRRHLRSAIDEGIDNRDGVINPSTIAVIEDDSLPDLDSVSQFSIVDMFDIVSDAKAERIKAELAELEADHNELVGKIGKLKSAMLIAKLDEQATEIEARIAAKRAELEPLTDRWSSLHKDLASLREKIFQAEKVMAVGSNRMKAEALRACIDRVELSFDYSKGGKSRLVRVDIVPQIGERQTLFRNDDVSRHD